MTDALGTQATASATLAVAEHEGENEETWRRSVAGAGELTGDWREDLVAIAETQLGYVHSDKDFIIDGDGVRHPYTRYGAWSGDAYTDGIDGAFVAFCLSFAKIPDEDFPQSANVDLLRQSVDNLGALENDRYTPAAGDLVFFWTEEGSVGIVTSVGNGEMTFIMGTANGRVSGHTWSIRDERVEGFANMKKIMIRAGKLEPTAAPTEKPEVTEAPTVEATEKPEVTEAPTTEPTEKPEVTETPTTEATEKPEITEAPATEQTTEPTEEPTAKPTDVLETETPAPATPGEAGEEPTTPGEAEAEPTAAPDTTATPDATAEPYTYTALEGVVTAAAQGEGTLTATVITEDHPLYEQSAEQFAMMFGPDMSAMRLFDIEFAGEGSAEIALRLDAAEFGQRELTLMHYLAEEDDWEMLPFTQELEGEYVVLRFTPDSFSPFAVIAMGQTEDELNGMFFGPMLMNFAVSFQAEGDTPTTTFSLDLQYKAPDQSNFVDVVGNQEIDPNGSIRFGVNFTVPAHALDNTDTISYKINNITLREPESGNVMNRGVPVGSYRIETDGTVSVTFFDNYVSKNKKGATITGNVTFDSSVSSLEKDEHGKVTLPYKDNQEIDLTVRGNTPVAESFSVKKSGNTNNADGTIDYTILVESPTGTTGDITLNDIITTDAAFSLVDVKVTQDYWPELASEKYTFTPKTGDSKGFDMTLPPLEKGHFYAITYKVKCEYENAEPIKVGNKVIARTEGEDDQEFSVEHTLTPEVLSKSGVALPDGTIKWTVVVNKSRVDISGWELSDQLNGQEYRGEVAIIPSSGGETIYTTLPYKFDAGSNDTYTIVYVTPGDVIVGSSGVENVATITPPGGGTSIDTPPQSVTPIGGGGNYNPLSKEGVKESEGDTTIVNKWTVSVEADRGDIGAPWTLSDELQNTNIQWFTGQQLKDAINSAVNAAAGCLSSGFDYTLEVKKNNGNFESIENVDKIETGSNYVAFKITFKEPLKKNSSFSYEYRSTADTSSVTQTQDYSNKVKLNDKVEVSGTVTYRSVKPSIKKTNGKGEGNATDKYEGDEVNSIDPLVWKIEITVPNGYKESDGDLKMTETLPEGVTVTSVTIDTAGSGEKELNTAGETDLGNGYTVYSTQTGLNINVTIPAELAVAASQDNEKINFTVVASINDDMIWETKELGVEKAQFKNSVKLTGKDEKEFGTGEQTQTIIKNTMKNVLAKKAADAVGNADHYKDNVIPYEVRINPEGKDLLEGADTLTLVDELIYAREATDGAYFYLVPSSVKLFEVNADGSRTQINPDQCPFTYTEQKNQYNNNWTNTLTMTVPDGKSLLLTYNYCVDAPTDQYKVANVGNTVSLEGITDSENDARDSVTIVVQHSGGYAELHGITLYKVEKNNLSKGLEGAVFRLSKYNPNTKKYESVREFTSDEKGCVEFNNLTFAENIAYMLEEITAPEGYYLPKNSPHYFYIKSENGGDVTKPDSFNGEIYMPGQQVFYPNELEKIDLEIDKRWFNPGVNPITGSSATPTKDSVDVEVYQLEDDGSPLMSDVVFRRTDGINDMMPNEFLFEGKYEIGTKISYRITATNWNSNWLPKLEINGEEKEGYIVDGTYVFDFEVTVRQENNITIERDNHHGWMLERVNVEYPQRTSLYATVTLSKENGWHATIEGVPKSKEVNGSLVYYRYVVREEGSGLNYTFNYDGDNIVLTNNVDTEPPKMSVTVVKKWQDENGNPIRTPENPQEIEVQLYQVLNGNTGGAQTYGNTQKLKLKDGVLTYTWDNLPMEDNNKQPYSYFVKEVTSGNYTVSYWPLGANSGQSGAISDTGNITITNRLKPETTFIEVEKKWVGINGTTPLTEDEYPLDPIYVQVWRDTSSGQGTPTFTGRVITLTKGFDGNWKGRCDGLPKKFNGKDCRYFVREVNVPEGFEVVYTSTNPNTTLQMSGAVEFEGSATITNKKKLTTFVNIKKSWTKDGAAATPEYSKVYFRLLQYNENGSGPATRVNLRPFYKPGDANNCVEMVPINGRNYYYIAVEIDGVNTSKEVKLNGLQLGKKFKVEEVGYEKNDQFVALPENSTELAWTVTYGDDAGPEGTITATNDIKPTTSLNVQKVWQWVAGGNSTTNKDDFVRVQLYRKTGEEGSIERLNGARYIATLNNESSWKAVFDDLPAKNENGDPYIYYVREIASSRPGFQTSYDSPERTSGGRLVGGFTETDNGPTAVITNEEPSTSISVKKQWKDKDTNASVPPKYSKVYFELYDEMDNEVSLANLYNPDSPNGVIQKVGDEYYITVSIAEGATFKTVRVENLSPSHTYTVKEVGYADETGKFVPVTTEGRGPSWTASYEPGTPVAGNNTITVTNIADSTTSIKVKKLWKDAAGNTLTGNSIPSNFSATIQLFQKDAEGNVQAVETQPAVTLKEGTWEHTFENLPKRNESGLLTYYVQETEHTPDYYKLEYEATFKTDEGKDTEKVYGAAKNGWVVITNSEPSTEIHVKKNWQGITDEEAKNKTVEVQLYKQVGTDPAVAMTGEAYTKTLRWDADAAKAWTASFTGLPAKENGVDVKYFVKEKNVDGFITSYSPKASVTIGDKTETLGGTEGGYGTAEKPIVITNTKKTSIKVEKKWLRADGTEVIPKGASATIQLFQMTAGVDKAPVPAKKDGAIVFVDLPLEGTDVAKPWEYTFTDLPAADANGDITYYVQETKHTPADYEVSYDVTYTDKTATPEQSYGMLGTGNDDTIVVTNAQPDTKLSITKNWTDMSGTGKNAMAAKVYFKLCKQTTDKDGKTTKTPLELTNFYSVSDDTTKHTMPDCVENVDGQGYLICMAFDKTTDQTKMVTLEKLPALPTGETYTVEEVGYRETAESDFVAVSTTTKWNVTVGTPTTNADGTSVTVTNAEKGGAKLPSTGSTGTTTLYTSGTLLLMLAALLLARKRRRSEA